VQNDRAVRQNAGEALSNCLDIRIRRRDKNDFGIYRWRRREIRKFGFTCKPRGNTVDGIGAAMDQTIDLVAGVIERHGERATDATNTYDGYAGHTLEYSGILAG
jgi:hypothetical protein